MIEKTFFIHAGGSKTGSSALQNFFEINYSRLESVGFAYENRLNIQSEYEINSGNGMQLFNVLSANGSNENEIDNLVLSYFGKCQNAICSSEYFAELIESHWGKLIESTQRLNVRLEVIFCIRNVIPYFLSTYDQVIKSHGGCISFDEWVKDAKWQHAESLISITKKLPVSSTNVIHYDSNRKSLIEVFLNILGVSNSFSIDPIEQNRLINRSLNQEEREVLKGLNKRFGETFSNELSNLIIRSNPDAQGEPAIYSKNTCDFLEISFKEQVDWINNTFFNSQKVLSILPKVLDKKSSIQKPAHKKNKITKLETLILAWSLNKLQTIRKETTTNILTALKNATANHIQNSHPKIPADFNLLAYLIFNQDILLSGADPILHYINQGCKENRRYKFEINEILMQEKTINSHSSKFENEKLIGAQYLQNEMLRNRNEMLTKALKQWQNYAKETSDKATQRERELYEQLLLAVKEKSK